MFNIRSTKITKSTAENEFILNKYRRECQLLSFYRSMWVCKDENKNEELRQIIVIQRAIVDKLFDIIYK